MNELKMTSAADASRSIVLSFACKWEKSLSSESVKCVFRKRAPIKFTPEWIYVYVGSPRSAIIGRCDVLGLERISTPNALAMVEEGALTGTELRDYAHGYDELYVYRITKMNPFSEPISLAKLNTDFNFSAPQNFFVLSECGKKELDTLAALSKTVSKKEKAR